MLEFAVVLLALIVAWSIGYRDGRRIGRLEGIVEKEARRED